MCNLHFGSFLAVHSDISNLQVFTHSYTTHQQRTRATRPPTYPHIPQSSVHTTLLHDTQTHNDTHHDTPPLQRGLTNEHAAGSCSAARGLTHNAAPACMPRRSSSPFSCALWHTWPHASVLRVSNRSRLSSRESGAAHHRKQPHPHARNLDKPPDSTTPAGQRDGLARPPTRPLTRRPNTAHRADGAPSTRCRARGRSSAPR